MCVLKTFCTQQKTYICTTKPPGEPSMELLQLEQIHRIDKGAEPRLVIIFNGGPVFQHLGIRLAGHTLPSVAIYTYNSTSS